MPVYTNTYGYSPSQIKVIEAVLDTFFAKLSPQEQSVVLAQASPSFQENQQVQTQHVTQFCQLNGSDLNAAQDFMYLTRAVTTDKQFLLGLVLHLLASPTGTKLLCGGGIRNWVPFYDLSRPEREQALLRIGNSKISKIRFISSSFMALSMFCTYGKAMQVPSLGPYNPIWKAIGYPGPVPEKPRPHPEDMWRPTFIDISQLSKDGKTASLSFDVVVIGSGAGGGIVAAELSKEGHKVVLIDKAIYTHPSDLPLTEMTSFDLLYEGKGTLMSEDGGLRILAGTAWGGGTAVNWSACLQLPEKARKEWAKEHKLPYFTTPEYQKAIDAVIKRAGISDAAIKQNEPNSILFEGCQKLGYHVEAIPQNTAGHEHSWCVFFNFFFLPRDMLVYTESGLCTFGCPFNEKQGSMQTWIKDAAEAGCQFIQGAWAEKVLTKNGKATGVLVKLQGGYQVTIKASKVVVSCGSIGTPSLLLRSGLKNPNVGRNLRLHPVTTVSGIFPDRQVSPFKGSIMTAVSNVVADKDGSGYGARLEIPAAHPSMVATLMPWKSASDHKRLMSQFDHIATFIVLCRDKDSNSRVYIDKEGQPRVEFNLSSYDADSILRGIVAGIEVLIAAGAREIITLQSGVPTFKVPQTSAPLKSREYQQYIQQVKAADVKPLYTSLFCAHQMGSCRMGSSPSRSVVDPTGESWEFKNLHVADASLFPTASGANPMLTTFSLAFTVAQCLKKQMREELKRGQVNSPKL